mgnify:CR=1 FL=1
MRGRGTDRVEEAAELDGVGGVLEVGVVAHDGGRLAAELEDDRLEVLAAQGRDDLADPSRAGEVDLADRLARDQGLGDGGSVLGRDVNDREDASGKAGLVHDLGDDGVRARRHLARLEDGRVARHDGLVDRALREGDGRVPCETAKRR